MPGFARKTRSWSFLVRSIPADFLGDRPLFCLPRRQSRVAITAWFRVARQEFPSYRYERVSPDDKMSRGTPPRGCG